MLPGAVHKKKASLIPLVHEYLISSDAIEEEGGARSREEGPLDVLLTPATPSQTVLSRKAPGRPKTPDAPPCSCNTTAIPTSKSSQTSNALLPQMEGFQAALLEPQKSTMHSSSSAPSSSTVTEVPVSVDGHRALVTLTTDGLRINYSSATKCCFIPVERHELIPFSEILSAQVLVPVVTKWLWRPVPESTSRVAVYTFRRSTKSPTHWFPRCIIISTPTEGLVQTWAAAINAAAAAQVRRPRHLLVLINPYGGKRQAAWLYARQVAPVFEKAGIKCTIQETQYCGHARALILDLPAVELAALDGIVAVGGDGLFHEIVNGMLTLRAMGVRRTTTDAAGGIMAGLTATGASSTPSEEQLRRAAIAGSLRVGHIPAGSTDAVACTLNGTRSAFSAAMRIALGDGVPLDVLRIDAADGTTEFATSMASYGFMGDLMAESEGLRWMGPLRYELVGARMLAANRSYRARISYLPADVGRPGSFSRVCTSRCDVCFRPQNHGGSTGKNGRISPTPFARHSRHSLGHRAEDWVTVEDDFAGVMLVIMPCRSDKSAHGVARYGHLSDGNIHLVLVRRCTRLQYFSFLLRMSSVGLEAGRHGSFVEVIPAVAVRVEPGGGVESQWNIDGELLKCAALTAETHRGAIEVFSRGVEDADMAGW